MRMRYGYEGRTERWDGSTRYGLRMPRPCYLSLCSPSAGSRLHLCLGRYIGIRLALKSRW